MKIIYLKLVLVFIIIYSCSQEHSIEKSSYIEKNDFSEQVPLVGQEVIFDEPVLRPTRLYLYDKFLLTVNMKDEQIIHIYDLTSRKKIGERIKKGQGPDDMIAPYIVAINDDCIWIYDLITSKCNQYAMCDFIENNVPTLLKSVRLEKPTAGEIGFLQAGILGVNSESLSQFDLFDYNGKKKSTRGEYPKTNYAYTDAEQVESFRFSFITNGSDKVAICYNWTDLIDIITEDGYLLKRMHGPDHFVSDFKDKSNGNMLIASPKKEQIRDAFFCPVNVGNGFFVLYSGKSENEDDYNMLANNIFAYNWDGSPESIFTLDKGVFAITVDEKNKVIYGISDTPDFHILAFHYK